MQFKTQPRDHQTRTFELAKDLPGWGCFWSVGSGKSYMAILFLRWKYNLAGKILPTIIITPPRPVPGWKKQWLTHTHIKDKQVIPLVGTGKQRIKLFKEATAKTDELVFITNYESLLMPELFKLFKEWGPRAIVADESHRIKNYAAQRSKKLDELANPYCFTTKKLLPKPYTYILSGSPILTSPMDLFMQFKILDGGKTFGWNFFAFRARYFRDRNAGMPKYKYFPQWEIMTKEKDNFDALGEIQSKMALLSNYIEKKDCLDLPPELDEVIEVGMSRDQERAYREMKNDLITFYKSRACTASLAITKALRLMQIVSGYVAVETPGEVERKLLDFEDSPRIEAFKEWLEEMLECGQSVLVWAVFKHNYKALGKAIDEVFAKMKVNYSWVECHGDISSAKQNAALQKFQNDPECRVFMGHPKSGGIGVNELMKAGVDLVYSRDFSLESYIQSRGRNHRDGTREMGHSQIIHYNMITTGTIDELAHNKLVNKQDMSDKLLSEIVKELTT